MNTDKSNASRKAPSDSVGSDRVFDLTAYPEKDLTRRILAAAMAVHNVLGAGFLEKVYENAMAYELRQNGMTCLQQPPLTVIYKGVVVGDYFADILVENRVLVELKACNAIDEIHRAQVLNYLRASSIRVGLLLNFGRPKLEYHRLVV